MKRNKSLMVFDDQVLHFDGAIYSSDEAHILFMIGLADHYEDITFCTRVSPQKKRATYAIPQNIKICALPYYSSVPQLLTTKIHLVPPIFKILKNNIINWDEVWISWPTPIGLLILLTAKLFSHKTNVALVVRQNLKALLKLRYNCFIKFFGYFILNAISFLGWLWRRHVTVFAVGREMFSKYSRHYKSVFLTKLPPLSQKDVIDYIKNKRKKDGRLNLLYIGRLEPEKGIGFLLDAIKILKEEGIDIHLNICGSGIEEKKLSEYVEHLKISNDVSFLGYIKFGEQLFNLYLDADFFVLPSLSEGFPNVIMEAMAFGAVIVSSDVGGISEVINHRESGWLFKPGSAKEIANSIRTLKNDQNLSNILCENAKKIAHQFTFEKQQKLMIDYLDQSFNK